MLFDVGEADDQMNLFGQMIGPLINKKSGSVRVALFMALRVV